MNATAVALTLGEAVRGDVVVADGGLSTWLAAQGHDVSGPLWSARLLVEDPDAVRAGHRAFARAGARVLTTATYQASPGGFGLGGSGLGGSGLSGSGLDDDGAAYPRIVARAVRLAREAAEESGPSGQRAWVAGSLGPWGAVLADGSEYTGAYAAPAGAGAMDVAALRRAHRPRLAALAEAGPDVIACETLPCLAEVEALVTELEALDVPAWVSLTAVLGADRRVTTRLGEPLAEAFALAAALPGLVAAGVNCCDPAVVAPAAALARAAGVPFVAMPNLGPWDERTQSWTPSPGWVPDLLDAVAAGRPGPAAGALVGGCCGVHPDRVKALAEGCEALRRRSTSALACARERPARP